MNSLGKEERIKSRDEIKQLFSGANSLKVKPIRLAWVLNHEKDTELKVAFSAPKRHFKKAVSRNKVKRTLREAYRNHKNLIGEFEGQLLLMFIVQSSEVPSFSEVQEKIILLLQRLSDSLSTENHS